jgi:release factor H-coupled RctB family protein
LIISAALMVNHALSYPRKPQIMNASIIKRHGPKVRVIASDSTWIEGESIRQLKLVSELPGMIDLVGMPDIQPGKGSPSGAAFLSDRMVHPSLVGTDIGCGMGLWGTDMPIHKVKVGRIVEKMNGLDTIWDGNVQEWLSDRDISHTAYDSTLGTPGRGNHFIELQQIDSIVNQEEFQNLNMSADRLHILVHSGSRGLGEAVLNDVIRRTGASALAADTPAGQSYIVAHDHAVRWAKANRELCAHRVCESLKIEASQILDICHNSVVPMEVNQCSCWLHRKGAAPADRGPVVIPGSRGDLSALVVPIVGKDEGLWSLAHGAGRKIARHQAKEKLNKIHTKADLKRNRWGGRVICGEDQLAWEEAPECYKSLSSVIDDLVQADLIKIIAYLRPIITFKTSEGVKQERQDERKTWKNERQASRQTKRGNW